MKKLTAIITTLMLLVSLTACSAATPDVSIDRAKILADIVEVEGSYTLSQMINTANLISNEEVITTRTDKVGNKSVQLPDKELELSYKNTKFSPVGELQVDSYQPNGISEDDIFAYTDGPTAAFYEDGSIAYMRNFVMTRIDISPMDSYDAVLEVLKPQVSSLIDFSKYSQQDSQPETTIEEDGFGRYVYRFYNTHDGYITDFAKIMVNDDGEVSGLNIRPVPGAAADYDFQIDKEKEAEVLKIKAQDLAGDDATYVSHEVRADYTPMYTVYNGELCVEYVLGVTLHDIDNDQDFSFMDRILVPVRLITAER